MSLHGGSNRQTEQRNVESSAIVHLEHPNEADVGPAPMTYHAILKHAHLLTFPDSNQVLEPARFRLRLV